MARKQGSGGGNVRGRRKSSDCLETKKTGVKLDDEFTTSAKRALAIRRLWIFLLASALVLIGLVSAVGVRLF